MSARRLRRLDVGCFGGGTGLSSVLGGLKRNPWLSVNGIVSMFDTGGSSGQLRDELGVLPPGDILKCALALARNEGEARRVLLQRLSMFADSRLSGHTGGNLLLSMMERYSGDFLTAVDGLRQLLGCSGRVWPVSVEPATLCAQHDDGSISQGEVEIDARQARGRHVERLWLDPPVSAHPVVIEAIRAFEAVVIGPGSFFTSLMPLFLVNGVADALGAVPGPVVLVANLLTEGRGMDGFTAGEAVRRVSAAICRPIDIVIINTGRPPVRVLRSYAVQHKALLPVGDLPPSCEAIAGDFWCSGIARHDRRRLAYALWSVLGTLALIQKQP